MSSAAASNFSRVLGSGQFSFTAEIGPPMSGDAENVRKKARSLKGFIDAANITDNQTAIVRMSSIAAGYLARAEGVEPIIQMTCRDRNRIALQSDLLGACALGLRNVLILSGDHQSFGNHPAGKNVYDVDSIQLLDGLRALADDGLFMGGSKLKTPIDIFPGTTANPFADPRELQLIRLEKKIRAGAKFVQTQGIYDIAQFSDWMESVRLRGLHERARIIAGVVVNKTQKSMEMTALVPGMDIPDVVLERMRAAKNKEEEGIGIALDLIGDLKNIEGVAGVHVMAIGWESAVKTIAERSGMLPRPSFEEKLGE
jgi:methylenetetrahydrofolate reductase (NADPH)